MKKLLIPVFFFASMSVMAGDKVGNGGDVIVCPDQRTVVLDLYQGSVDWGFETISREGSRMDIVVQTLSKFASVDPVIGARVLSRATEMEMEISKLENDETYRSKLVKLTKNVLVNISDEGVAELPPGCEIVQAATQIQAPFPGEVKFTFQKDTWLSLDADVQASLILHEVIYEHLISVGEVYSRSTRYMNAALHAGKFDTVKGYFDVSSLFAFRNLAIIEDGNWRTFGATKKCAVKKHRGNQNDDAMPVISISIGWRTVATKSEHINDSMNIFWKKHVTQGACD